MMKFTTATILFHLLAVFCDAVLASEGEDPCNPSSCPADPCATTETEIVRGMVFEDENGNNVMDGNETGICGIMVSDGLHVTKTKCNGCYILDKPTPEVEEAGMFFFVTEPDGYDVPRTADNVPKFYYMHKPNGSPLNVRNETFRYMGLNPTGDLPDQIDFPLIKTAPKPQFKIVTSGDTQTYSNDEMNYYRDTVVKEWMAMDDLDAIVLMGDVMGDDLTIYKRLREATGLVNVPQYYAAGNHDLDFDAPSDSHSFDTFRREFGPEYYSFEIGNVHFVVLDDVKYPCGEEDNLDGLHNFCVTGTTYNGEISERQLQWLKNDLEHVPMDKLIFLQFHIPIHSFIDMNLVKHSIDNAVDLYEALGCVRSTDGLFRPQDCERKIVSLSGHTHTTENMYPGEDFEGWSVALDSGDLAEGRAPGPNPFHQMIIGAASGTWWAGDLNINGNPEGIQRLGSPKGYVIWEFDGSEYVETYKASEMSIEKQMSIDFSTPAFRDWFTSLRDWFAGDPADADAPPENIYTLPDTKAILQGELSDTLLTANVWAGTRVSEVNAYIRGRPQMQMTRTQLGAGENILETLDPYALKRQMMVARHAYATTKDARANGFELFRGSNQCPEGGPCTPRPQGQWTWTDQSSHIWQMALPDDLETGFHEVTVEHIDWHGRRFTDTVTFEVVAEYPPRFFKSEDFALTP